MVIDYGYAQSVAPSTAEVFCHIRPLRSPTGSPFLSIFLLLRVFLPGERPGAVAELDNFWP